jgi:hypothetical protein
MPRTRKPIEELRIAVRRLPEHTRRAMLDGVRTEEIIVGAYSDGHGGVCPMLAAHRRGGRTELLAFARAWDRFTAAQGRARRATRRELRVLVSHLEAAGLPEPEPGELARAISDHRALREAARTTRGHRPGDRNRSGQLQAREGWAWLRPFRRYDDYRRALALGQAQHEDRAAGPHATREAELA